MFCRRPTPPRRRGESVVGLEGAVPCIIQMGAGFPIVPGRAWFQPDFARTYRTILNASEGQTGLCRKGNGSAGMEAARLENSASPTFVLTAARLCCRIPGSPFRPAYLVGDFEHWGNQDIGPMSPLVRREDQSGDESIVASPLRPLALPATRSARLTLPHMRSPASTPSSNSVS